MVDIPSNLPPITSDKTQQTNKADASIPSGGVDLTGMPQPFPGLDMTSKEKQQFWNTMMNQMNTVINKNTEKAREALRKLKADDDQ